MTKRVDPLSYKVPIVDSQGRPTREFMRKWSQQAESNSGVPDLSTAAKVSAVLDKIAATAGAVLVRGTTAWQGLFLGGNPTATASDVAVNGTATTFMRSDAAPAIQKTSSTQFGVAKVDGTSITAVGGVVSTVNNGTVTSVGMTMPAEFTVTGSPIAGAGTLAVSKANQNAGLIYAGPASGAAAAPSFRAMSVNDPSGWGFTAGSVPFMTATGIAQDNANFFWNASLKRLGLGTSNPGTTLEVAGNGILLANTVFFTGRTFAGTPQAILGVWSDDFVKMLSVKNGINFQDSSGITKMTFLENGNFGIGVSPAIALDVAGPIGAQVYTVATLPSATVRAGQLAFVSDATLTASTGLGIAPTGGGTNFVPVYSDGAGWKIL